MFSVTLVCPIPRVGFGKGDLHVDNELAQMEDYLARSSCDFVVFPEGFITEEHIPQTAQLASRYRKWVVCGAQATGEHQDLSTLVFDPDAGLIYKHLKTSLTLGDVAMKATQGKTIEALETPFCTIGTVLCYEIHFPEVARIEAIEGAKVLFNTIGTGMWHAQQLDEWTTVAKARAIENRCFVLGCTHFCDPIPLMFAYDPHGRQLALELGKNGSVDVTIDLAKIDDRDFERDRNPVAYKKLSEVKI